VEHNMSSLVPSRLFLLLPLISLASCHCGAPKLDTGGLEPGDADTDVDADTDADTDGDTDTDTGCDDPAGCFLDATITGTVTVRPYTVDTNGDIVLRTWDEIGVAFPFGPSSLRPSPKTTAAGPTGGRPRSCAPPPPPTPIPCTSKAPVSTT
jgi:hypothetical protein